jgi:hypothetical protein
MGGCLWKPATFLAICSLVAVRLLDFAAVRLHGFGAVHLLDFAAVHLLDFVAVHLLDLAAVLLLDLAAVYLLDFAAVRRLLFDAHITIWPIVTKAAIIIRTVSSGCVRRNNHQQQAPIYYI